ncbi:MAG: hypothetical protein BGO97_03785 [Micrococcales bacterium 70-64]|nr:hypothetical protein [Leifsonia sp.]ODU63233.1 MAG: hypothetical protein ABT06_03790 [Leifsonia sp. SCN 70-46]OJX84924.1 MAG: hypothetical protein BGO97_03785 [Micrococcales bacterium 70-64]
MARTKELERLDSQQRVELAVRAVMLRREGHDYDDIAVRIGVSATEAAELTRVGYGRLAAQTADELRTEVEDRLNGLLRSAHVDLKLADSQGERTALYRTILAIEGRRAQLLGLDLPKATPGE